MPRQVLTLKLEGITAGDYLTWCRDPEPPALDYTLRSVRVDADPLGDTITAVLDWKHRPPSPSAAAIAAGLPLSPAWMAEGNGNPRLLETVVSSSASAAPHGGRAWRPTARRPASL